MHRLDLTTAALSIFIALLLIISARSEESRPLRPVRVAIFSGDGVSKDAPAQVRACLPVAESFEVESVTAKDIRGGALEKFDVIIHPGGSGSGQAKSLGEAGREKVREFVKRGGGYVGVCAGAYLASAEYPWALKLLDARVVDDEHWARGTGDVKLQITAAGRDALSTKQTSPTVHYENGPLLGPAKRSEIPDFESLATFETEIRKNDAPKGVMLGTTAIARGTFGKGRVVCFSPHPEKSRGCEAFLTEGVKWAGSAKKDGHNEGSANKR
jgi:glutamine amidotransferase-like uncharacterized protein